MEIKAPYLVIVEDNPDDSFWLKRALKKAGLETPVVLFADGKTALEFLSKSKILPTALFLDLHLPIISGLELLRSIKSSPCLHKIVVFVLDGSSSPREIEECKQLGVAGFLDKPVTAEDLTNEVAQLFYSHTDAKAGE